MEENTSFSINKIMEAISGDDSKDHLYLFRGHSDKSYELKPSIYRKSSWISNEDKMIRELIIRCPYEFSQSKSAFEKLVKMQHYGMPTRLLDVTENPLVALYFACFSMEQSDGELLMFKIPKNEIKYYDSDTVSVISNLSWQDADFGINEHDNVNSFNVDRNQCAAKLLHSIKNEKPHFKNKIDPQHIQSVVCVKPLLDNQRIARQSGLFFLYGIGENKTRKAEIPDHWAWFPNEKRVIIKSEKKKFLLKELSQLGIHVANLFPEIENVSAFIKEGLGWETIESKFVSEAYPKNFKMLFTR